VSKIIFESQLLFGNVTVFLQNSQTVTILVNCCYEPNVVSSWNLPLFARFLFCCLLLDSKMNLGELLWEDVFVPALRAFFSVQRTFSGPSAL